MEKNKLIKNKTLIPITKEQIDNCFTIAKEQWQYLISLYKLVYHNFEYMEIHKNFPKISEKTWHYICSKCIEFDQIYHKNILQGGLWMNRGFSGASETELPEWVVDITNTTLIFKTTRKLYKEYIREWFKDHAEFSIYGNVFLFPLWDANMQPACFEEWFDNEYRELKEKIINSGGKFVCCDNCGALIFQVFNGNMQLNQEIYCKICDKSIIV